MLLQMTQILIFMCRPHNLDILSSLYLEESRTGKKMLTILLDVKKKPHTHIPQ